VQFIYGCSLYGIAARVVIKWLAIGMLRKKETSVKMWPFEPVWF